MTEDDIYTEKGIDEELDDDEISPEEAGFMKGETEASDYKKKKVK